MAEFRMDRDAFVEAITWAGHGVARQGSATPVLSMIQVEVGAGVVKFAGFDFDTFAGAEADADVAAEGVAYVPGRVGLEVARSLPSAGVEFSSEGGKTQIRCGRTKWTLMGLANETASDYPELPAMPAANGVIPVPLLTAAVAQVAVAASRDETTPMLTGIQVEAEGDTLTLVASDRYRLAVRRLPWKPVSDDVSVAVLIPARALTGAVKALRGAEVTAAFDAAGGLAGFESGSRRVTTRLLEREFPNWRRLIPSAGALTGSAVVNAHEFVQAVQRVAVVAERERPVFLTFGAGEVRLEAGTEGDAASDVVEVELDGEGIEMGFNPQYLIDAVTGADSATVRVSYESSRKGALVTACAAEGEEQEASETPGYQHVVMPKQVR